MKQPITIWQLKTLRQRIQRSTEYANNMAMACARHFSTTVAQKAAQTIICDRILSRKLSKEKLYENSPN